MGKNMSNDKLDINNLNISNLPYMNLSTGIMQNSGIDNIFSTNMSCLPYMNLDTGIIPNSNIENIFPTNMNFTMPEFNSFGLCSDGFSQMLERQQQNMFASMFQNFCQALQNYKMPHINFNFTNPDFAQNQGADYGNYTQKATDLYQGSAEDLNKNLSGVLKGKGKKLLELQKKYGVSAALMAAIVNNESAYGTSNAAKNKNNVAGIMSASSNYTKLATFASVDDCLESLAKNLKNNYINKGLITISQIHEKYCPIGASNDPKGMNQNWGRVVAELTDKYNNLA